MQCPQCGYDNPIPQQFCPNCGANTQMPMQNNATAPILAILKDNLFMVLCILVSAGSVLSLSVGSIPLLSILAAVFLWLAYTKASKDEASAEQLRNLSGTVYAHYIITFVIAALVTVFGLLFSLGLSIIFQDPAMIEEIIRQVGMESGLDSYDMAQVRQVFEVLGTIPASFFTVIFIMVGVAVIVLNIFSIRYIHRFIKSVYMSLQNGRLELDCVKAAKTWLWIYGIFSAVSALGSLGDAVTMVSALATGCNAATYIIAAILVGKLTANTPVQEPQF